MEDTFQDQKKHIEYLFSLIKRRQEDVFVEYVSRLSVGEIDVNTRDANGNYLIFFAVITNSIQAVEKLIEYGSRLDLLDSEGFSILYNPIKFDYREILDVIIDNNVKTVGISVVNIKDTKGDVPLFYAVRYRNSYALEKLLASNADANYRNNNNVNVLHLAIILRRDVNMIRLLVNRVKNLTVRTSHGLTALHYACNFQLLPVVELLIQAGVNQNVIELENDFYPIFYAVIQNNFPITKLLIDNKCNPNHQDYQGNTIIHYAIMGHHAQILDYILNAYRIRGSNPDVFVEDINTHEDVPGDHIDPNIVNIDGLTITHLILYDYAEQPNYLDYIQKLIIHSNLNYQDNQGNTILHIVVEKDLWTRLDTLLDFKKLNIFVRNNEGKTIIDMVPFKDRETFIGTVVRSYYKYLKKYENSWTLEWQNQCSMLTEASKLKETDCFRFIRETIINQNTSIPIKRDRRQITVIIDDKVDISTFTGSLLDVVCGFKYLTQEYPYATSLLNTFPEPNADLERYNLSLGFQENPKQHIIHFEIRWIYQRIFFPTNFESTIRTIIEKKSHRYLVVPISIILSNGNHANGLLYDFETDTMERFEPHGSDYPNRFNYNPDLLDEILFKKVSVLINTIRGENTIIKYYQPKNYMPKIGFQTFENNEISINKNIGDPNGFCALWTIWYFDYRLKYYQKKPQNLVKNLIRGIKINNWSFRTIIRNYSKKITDLRDKYLLGIGRRINDYINNNLTDDEIQKLINLII